MADLNGGQDEDEALRLAIAISLGQDPASAPPESTTDAPNSSARNVAMGEEKPGSSAALLPPHQPPLPQSSSSLGLLGIDRRKMEEERLERIKKRKAAESLIEGNPRPAQRPKPYAVGSSSKSASAAPGAGLAQKPSNSSAPSSSMSDLPFPRGVVKKTWAFRFPRLGDDIKIEEVLQKESLELAVLSR
jgi:hypothetical protein